MTIWSPAARGPRRAPLSRARRRDRAGRRHRRARRRRAAAAAPRSRLSAGRHGRHREPRLRAGRGARPGQPARSAAAPSCAPPTRAPRVNPVDDGDADLIKLTVNAPPDPSDHAILRDGLTELAARPSALQHLMSYTPKRGLADHRAAAAAWIGALGIEARADDVILTGGAHQALFATLFGLAAAGDGVLIEQLTYAGICHIGERAACACAVWRSTTRACCRTRSMPPAGPSRRGSWCSTRRSTTRRRRPCRPSAAGRSRRWRASTT